ncbi:MAG: hypothetical protein IPP14_12330 [Planctomycetes bacterium]|nr:hypothetical protein [Planctomycetota bacterium]
MDNPPTDNPFPQLAALAGRLRNLATDEPGRAEVMAELDAGYWRTLTAALRAAATAPLAPELRLDTATTALADFGVLSAALAPVLEQPRQPALATQWFHQALAEVWQDRLRFAALQHAKRRLQAVMSDLREWPEFHLALIRTRDQMVLNALGDSPGAQHVLRLFSEMDERLEQFKRWEHRSQQGFHAHADRKQWLSIKAYMDERRAQQDPLLQPLRERAARLHEQLGQLESAVSRAFADFKAAQRDSELAQRAILRLRQSTAEEASLFQAQRNLAEAMFAQESAQKRMAQAQSESDALRTMHWTALACEQLESAAEAVSDSVGRLLELHQLRQEEEAAVEAEQRASAQVTPEEIRDALQTEAASLRGQLRLAANYARVPECSVALDEQTWLSPADAHQAMTHIEQFDPRVFANDHVRRHGRPSILLAPGHGEAVYDADHNRLTVPLHPVAGALASLASGIALYRLHVDSLDGKQVLLNSFRDALPESTRPRSKLKLRNRLWADYRTWISAESLGERVLDREARLWFEARIAPSKGDPWVPVAMLDLNERQVQSRLLELEKAPPGPDRHLLGAILHWLLAPHSRESISMNVLPRIDSALLANPDDPATLYSGAALHMKAKSFQRAIALFEAFQAKAPKSWWTRKAAELSAQCR